MFGNAGQNVVSRRGCKGSVYVAGALRAGRRGGAVGGAGGRGGCGGGPRWPAGRAGRRDERAGAQPGLRAGAGGGVLR